MAFATVQTSSQTVGTGNSIVITTSATKKDNLVVVGIHYENAGGETCTGVTDDKGNAYVLSAPNATPPDNVTIYMAYGVQITGGTTSITCSFSGTVESKTCGADEYSGGALTNASIFDKTSTGAAGGTALSVTSFSPTKVGELIVAVGGLNNNLTWTAGTNYTLYNGGTPARMRTQYRLVGAATETAPMSVSSDSFGWREIAMAFKERVEDNFGYTKPNKLRPRIFSPGLAR